MNEPNTENVVYMDEYPHLEQKVKLKHRAMPRSIGAVVLRFHSEEQELDGLRQLMEEPPQVEKLFET